MIDEPQDYDSRIEGDSSGAPEYSSSAHTDTEKVQFFKGDWRAVNPRKIPIDVPEWANVVLLATHNETGLYPFAMKYPDQIYTDKLEEVISQLGAVDIVVIPANTNHMLTLARKGELIKPEEQP